MINNNELIEKVISKLGVSDKANLIKSALSKDINKKQLEADNTAKNESSKARFDKARAKWEDEKRIFESSQKVNALSALEKSIKTISSKLEALGF